MLTNHADRFRFCILVSDRQVKVRFKKGTQKKGTQEKVAGRISGFGFQGIEPVSFFIDGREVSFEDKFDLFVAS